MKRVNRHGRRGHNPTARFCELKFPAMYQNIHCKGRYHISDLDMIEVDLPVCEYLKQHGFDRVFAYEQVND